MAARLQVMLDFPTPPFSLKITLRICLAPLSVKGWLILPKLKAKAIVAGGQNPVLVSCSDRAV
jgi:hypothetical protein